MNVKEKNEKSSLKLNIQKTKIMASSPITSWQIDGETMGTVTDFIFLGSKNHCGWWLQPWNQKMLVPWWKSYGKPWKESDSEVTQSCPTLCDPMDCKPTRLLCPCDFPGKSTRVGCHFLLQGIFPTKGWNPGLLHYRQTLYYLSHQGSPRILKWVTMPFPRGSSQPKDRTCISYFCIGWRVLYHLGSSGKTRQCIKKQRHHFANKDPYSQSYGFYSSHKQMWESDHKEGWVPKN